jgi:hypothetical protein
MHQGVKPRHELPLLCSEVTKKVILVAHNRVDWITGLHGVLLV